jgi:hypothetical protein
MRKFLLVVSYTVAGLLILVLLTHDKQTTTTPAAPTGTDERTADDPEFFAGADDSHFTRCGGALAIEDLLRKKAFVRERGAPRIQIRSLWTTLPRSKIVSLINW